MFGVYIQETEEVMPECRVDNLIDTTLKILKVHHRVNENQRKSQQKYCSLKVKKIGLKIRDADQLEEKIVVSKQRASETQ